MSAPSAPLRKRPRSVTILVLMQCIQSMTLLGTGLYLLRSTGLQQVVNPRTLQFLPLALFDNMLSALAMILVAIFGLATAVALYRLRSWAWMIDMVLQGLGLMAALAAYVHQMPNYVGMATGILMVFFLNGQEVRLAFHEGRYTPPEGVA